MLEKPEGQQDFENTQLQQVSSGRLISHTCSLKKELGGNVTCPYYPITRVTMIGLVFVSPVASTGDKYFVV